MMVFGRQYTVDSGRWGRLALLAALCLLFTVYRPPSAYAGCTPPSDGLIGHWTLDETSGTSATDSAGGNTGTMQNGLSGASNSVAGKIGTALSFDGTDDYISVANESNFDFEKNDPYTLSAWIYRNDNTTEDDLIEKTDSSANWQGYALYFESADDRISFVFSGSSASDEIDIVTNGTVSAGGWHHVALTYDGSITTAGVKIYIDGVNQTFNTAYNALSSSTLNNSSLMIGSDTGDPCCVFDGKIDDVRVYNRALSADEIEALYATRSTADAVAGQVEYDARHARLMYCDGTNWVHAGTGGYNPDAIHFDGSDYVARNANLTGVTDSKVGTFSAWVRMNVTGSNMRLLNAGTYDRFAVDTNDGTRFRIYLFDNAGNGIGNYYTHNTKVPGVWYHILASWDLGNGKEQIYVNDVDDHDTSWDAGITDANIGYTAGTPEWSVGARPDGWAKWNGDIADVWFSTKVYMDLDNVANRRKFIDASGMPMYLGQDGSIPTGSPPDIFLSGDISDWATNKGTGGGFTVTGTLEYSSAQPGDSLIPAGDITTGLVSRWALDETSGTAAADSAGNNDGTMANGLDAGTASVAGAVGAALHFDSTSEQYINIANESAFDFTTSFSASLWVRMNAFTYQYETALSKIDSNTNTGWGINRYDYNSTLAFFVGGLGTPVVTSSTGVEDGLWHHVVGVFNDANDTLKIYIDGVEDGSIATGGGTLSLNDYPLSIGYNSSVGFRQWGGDIDDVRIYNRALSADDVKLLYNCSAPDGAVKYDPGFHVMSYCNGAEWVSMGKIGGTPPESGLVANWKLDETSGDAADSVGGYTGTFRTGGNANWAPTGGILGGAYQVYGDTSDTDGIRVPYNAVFDTVPFTASIWVKPAVVGGYWGTVLVQRANNGAYRTWRLQLADDGKMYFGATTAGGVQDSIVSDAAFAPGDWYHIVATMDSAYHMEMYINGVKQADTLDLPDKWTADDYLQIGQEDGLTLEFNGLIDDVRFYNRVLDPTEIQQLYHYGASRGLGGASGNCANPAMPEGAMVYNKDYNVLQYCNGQEWIGVGQ